MLMFQSIILSFKQLLQKIGRNSPGFFSKLHQQFIRKHTKQIIKDGLFQFIGISILVGFLLYLLHILVGFSFGVQQVSANIQNKLGVYFYIKDVPGQQDVTYSKVIEMKEKLEKLGIKVTYLSKDDAIKSIGRKVPNVVQSFEKYGIKNPLPATVYILFDDMQQYDKLRKVVTAYQDIIANRDDISRGGQDLMKQEKRILHTLWFTDFIVYLSYMLIVILMVVILSFLVLVMRTKFDSFQRLVHIQQLLGTNYALIKTPFVISSLCIAGLGFVLSILFLLGTWIIIWWYTQSLFDSSLLQLIGKNGLTIAMLLFSEFLLLSLLVSSIWYSYLESLLQKPQSL